MPMPAPPERGRTPALPLALLLAGWALAAGAALWPLVAAGQAARATAPAANAGSWKPLARDGVHDPRGPAIGQLQEPAEALAALPPDSAGNSVHWVRAIDSGAITPRSQILPGTVERTLDQDLIVAKFGSMPAVKFPHRQHTLWLDCSNCHEKLFRSKAGANTFSMAAILNGEQCGLCHGAVAFPLTECNRCHSVPNASLQRRRRP